MEKFKRYVIFLLGLFISSFGVSLVTKANLGTSPISSIPYVLSLNFPFSLGNFTIVFSLFLILLQLIILKKNFKLEHLLQIPISIAFGYFIDITMLILGNLSPQMYVAKIIYLLLGCIILAFGVYLEVLANVAMLPGESFVRAIKDTYNTDFGITKICFDVSMTVIAVVVSFVCAGKLDGVREGTVIAALIVGYIARIFGRVLAFVQPMLFKDDTTQESISTDVATYPSVIVIGRQYGCGGHDIGKEIATKLGYNFYDKEIIDKTAGVTGYTPEFIEKKEENMTNSFLFDLVNQMYAYNAQDKAPKDNIFQSESNVICEMAHKGNCVIIGRCADYILRNDKNCLKVFLQAPIEYRVNRVMQKENISEKDARIKISKQDKARADNYHYYTNQVWGNASNYQLSIDTSLGDDYVIDVITNTLKAMK